MVKEVSTDARYSDSVGGVGGRASWDGAILLHWVQFSLVAKISLDMPGQNMEDSALAVMADVPW